MASKSTIEVRILGDNKGLKDSLDDSESKIGAFAGNAGKIAAAAAVAVGGAVVVALGKGFTDALAAQDNDALIAARLGLDPARAAELGDVAASAYRNAWGDSLAATTDTVTALAGSFEGLNDTSLENLTGQAIALGDVFGIDVAQGVQTASELVSSGLVASADEAFDLLTRGLQEMPPAIRDELLAASNEYGDFFADLGISGDTAFAKLTEFAEGGVYGIDKFGDALKELTIRGTDMSTASVAAYEAAGLSAEDMSQRFLAGGDVARGALEETAAGLLSIEDPVERANAAIALFGTPLEDLSVTEIPGFLEGLTDMSSGLGDVQGAAQDMADTVGGTTSAKLESFKRRALGGLADFAANNLLPPFESFLEWSEENWPNIRDAVTDAFDAVVDAWDRYGQPVFDGIVDVGGTVVAFFEESWPKVQDAVVATFDWVRNNKDVVIGALIGIGVAVATILVPAFVAWAASATAAAAATLVAAAPFIAVGAALAAVGAAAVWAYQNVDWFRDAVDTVARFFVDTVWPILQDTWAIIVEVVTAIVSTIRENWDTIQAVTTAVFDAIWGYLEAIWNTIYGLVDGYITAVRGIIQTITSLIRGDWEGVWNGIKTFIDGIWTAIKAVVTGAIDVVKNYLSTAMGIISEAWSTVWSGISTAVSDTWNGITGFVSDGIDDIVGFITGLPGRVASGIGSGFNALWENFRSVINRIIDGINSISLPGVTIGGWDPPGPGPTIPSFTTPTIDPFPYIPRFHSGIDRVPGRPGSEMLAILQAGERVTPANENVMGAGGPITLIIEGRPFSAMIAEHESAQVAELMAGVR